MNRFVLSSVLVVAACGGGNKETQPTSTVQPSHSLGESTAKVNTPASLADPSLAAREAFSNPGGMWLPMQMLLPRNVETLKQLGVQIDAKTLADPLSSPLAAVVSLGGCTASFVSPDGLIVTNHHCVQGSLQLNSTKDNNLVENGFLAKTRADEKSAGPAQRVMVAQSFRDVTKDMRDGLDAIKDPIARKDESEKRLKTLIAGCEKDRPGARCDVKSFFRGGMYQLIESLELRDIRLVYVPTRSVGNYGGELDNWMWPRHTGDWSFYRAYVGKDGRPADYSVDNVPYHPAHFLKVSNKGLKPSDFVMITGYPGSTDRLDTAAEVHDDVEWRYPYLIAYLKERYALAESHLKDAGETGIKAGVGKQGIQNGLAKYEGVLAGLTKGDLLARKDALDAKVRGWAAQPGHEAEAAGIAKLDTLLADQRRTERVDFDRGTAFGGSRLLGTALQFVRLAEERTKPDAERKPGYQERDMARMMGGQKAFAKQYDRTLDRAQFRLALVRALQLPDADRMWLATLLGSKPNDKVDEATIDRALEAWYKAPTIEDEKLRLQLLAKGTTKELKASKDPFIAAALRVWPIVKAEEKRSDARTGDLLLATPSYAAAMREVLDGFLAPDANGTLRITYGTVKSFKPESKEMVDWPFTVAAQILTKNTGTSPYDAPAKLLEAIKAKHFGQYADLSLGGDLPIDFLSDLDITGGNSGSPTLNSKGELVGLAFDGTLDGVASDVLFNGASTRTIQVDARYMLWTMDGIDGADHLVKEMGVTPTVPSP
jgi:V8-like Glu-specific endopeptidase